jgi:glycosyltransferase involved in cell wall biosynthesis
VLLVGSGMRFVSGLSYYTFYLAQAFAGRYETSVVLMRQLIPRALYPGRDRVGAPISAHSASQVAPTFDGINWTYVPSVPRALRFCATQDPDVVVLQWWTATSLPAYSAIVRWARRRSIPVVVELHEGIHAAEARIPLVSRVARAALARLLRRVDGYVVHSTYDRDRFAREFGLDPDRIAVVHVATFGVDADELAHHAERMSDECTIFFFGTIRPYKGLEHLVDAFDRLPREGARRWRLLVVGESWEGWRAPIDKINESPHRDDIEFVNRYVLDEEIPGFFARADVVALPYLVSSASGPLHMAMNAGLPLVTTNVGGLAEVANKYEGAVLVEPDDPQALVEGILAASELIGRDFDDPFQWSVTLAEYESVFGLLAPGARGER